MNGIRQKYGELIALTQLYLLQEHSLDKRLFTDSETFAYFRNAASRKSQANTPTTAQPATFSQTKAAVTNSPPTLPKQQLSPLKVAVPSAVVAKPAPLSTSPPTPLQDSTTQHSEVSKPAPSPLLKEPEAKKSPSKEKTAFVLEPMVASSPMDFADLKKSINEKLPHFAILDFIPDDAEAVCKAKLWEQKPQSSEVVILSFDEIPKENRFLTNLSKALQKYGIQASIVRAVKIEQEKAWENLLESKELRLVIASGYGIYSLPELLKHHREASKQGKHYLKETPLLLLSDISFYLKEPALKPSLWRALKDLLSIASSPL